MPWYVHKVENADGSRDRSRWQLLSRHLEGVADRAENHASLALKIAARGGKYDTMNRLGSLVERFEAELETIPIELAEPALDFHRT